MEKIFQITVACFFVITGKKNDAEWQWVLEILSELELIVDSYEQAIERPTD